jgi:hypothetical protein
MGIFDSLFGKKLFKPRPDDVKMWRSGRVCEPCTCFAPRNGQFGNVQLHADVQDTNCEAWKLLESLVEKSVNNCSEEFAPAMEMPPEFWRQIITLPTSIAKLTSVKRLYLYGSNLVRLPPEIGLMENLEELDIYTSYRLHWLPYEVTRCKKLSRSRASTRAHYGNYKYRPPFPQLGHESLKNGFGSGTCSVCRQSYSAESVRQVWISLRVATDVFPLLVYACSTACILNLPRPPEGYVNHPHAGGIDLKQPDPRIPLKSVH